MLGQSYALTIGKVIGLLVSSDKCELDLFKCLAFDARSLLKSLLGVRKDLALGY